MIFVDPDGMDIRLFQQRNNETLDQVGFNNLPQKNKLMLMNFIMSPQGKSFISQYLHTDQTFDGIKGTNPNENISANLDIVFHDRASSISASSDVSNVLGSTFGRIYGENEYVITIYMDQTESLSSMLVTFGHEAFVHALGNTTLMNSIMTEEDTKNKSLKEKQELYKSKKNTAHQDHKRFDQGKAKDFESFIKWSLNNFKKEMKLLDVINSHRLNNSNNVKAGK